MSHRFFLKPSLGLAILALALALHGSPRAGAVGTTFTVNATTDAVDANPGDHICAAASGKCTLRAAVEEANATSGADTIVLPAGTFKLTIQGSGEDLAASGDLDILEDVTIRGAGSSKTIIDANQIDRAFETYPVILLGHIHMQGLTIQNGVADSGGAILANAHQGIVNELTLTDVVISDSHATVAGGAIANYGNLVISESTIAGNRAASGDIGGGIFNAGNLTVTDSTISGNAADVEGGGLANFGGIVTMTNVTFSGNTAGTAGGAIYNGIASSQMTLQNVTLAGDSAPAAQEISHDNSGPFHLKNTIVAGLAPGKNCVGTLSSDGHNLSSDATCGLTHAGDKQNTDPMLGPLADNGGPTRTRALLASSFAIDTGSSDCPPPATDQRGTPRPQGARCDIGAFEAPAARVWGDLRCDGAVDASDSLAGLLNVATLSPISQTQPCPHIGDSVEVAGFSPHIWGDVDCTAVVNAADVLLIARYVAGLLITPIAGCPAIGATVQVTQ